MPRALRPHTWKILAIGWFLLTTILLIIPGNALPKTNLVSIPDFDKIVHVGLFAVLSALTFKSVRKLPLSKVFLVWLAITAYGTAMEYVQLYLVANRSFDVIDIIADSFGALLGYLVVRLFATRK
jgi:VanZ family protein